MKTLITLIIGMILSVSSFSQTISKPIIFKDSTGLTLYAFNLKQLDIIIKSLKENDINKKVILQLENEITLLKTNQDLFTTENDSLKSEIKTYIEIKINQELQISVLKKVIDSLNLNITDYKDIEDNYNKEIADYKEKIKRKNQTITKLVATEVVSLVIIVLLLLHH